MSTLLGFLSESAETENAIGRIQSLATAEEQLQDPDYWGSVGITALTGILVVFLILAILIFFFWLMGTIFKAIDKSKAEKQASLEAMKKTAPAPAPAAAPAVEEIAGEEDDMEEIVAVITAAIAAYEGGYGFEIRSIRKREKTRSAWSMAGISDNMNQL